MATADFITLFPEEEQHSSHRSSNDLATYPISETQRTDFWSRVNKDGPGGCWLWTGRIARNGYGTYSLRPRVIVGAHRLAWMLLRGPIPRGLLACHDCPDGDRRDCVNPAHLFLGTQQDNQDDCTRKGRRPRKQAHVARGERAGSAKLDERMVRAICRAFADGVSQNTLARWFDVSQQNISSIVRREKWSHVTLENQAAPPGEWQEGCKP